MKYSSMTDGFRLAYERSGSGDPVVLLHGWPGDHTDYDQLVPMLTNYADVIVPDLRGFGLSDKHDADPEQIYSGKGQARAVIALMEELGLKNAIICGYDVGSFISQTIATMRPDLVKALVVSPPLPGAGDRVLELKEAMEFWYTSFHNLSLFETLVDGKRDAARAYLHHFWSHWSGPTYVVDEARIDHLADVYSAPGAFKASVAWYRSSGNPVTAYATETIPRKEERIKTPTTVLWQENDPIFPIAWSDLLDEFFVDYTLERLEAVGHFTPLEATTKFASSIRKWLSKSAKT
ncbi:alpha/beta hydrolase [Pseudomonas sp. ME-P-057]|uniref:alpha/beta fold hydrolase n=1 Tax=Pseudomonas sp. ME-P-057 TaxID=3040321 RepID=UPI002553AE8B|nr:alpha/beta hydrolase [Pseudomonas sp. ME-P-057]